MQTDICPILQGLNEVNIPFVLILDHGYACLKSHVHLLLMIFKNASKFAILYQRDMTIHEHNLQLLMAEISRTKNNINSTLMKNEFTERDAQYNLRRKNHLQLSNVKRAKYGIECIQYTGQKINDSGKLTNYKQKIKSW